MRGAVALQVLLFCLSGTWAQGERGGVSEGGESRERDAEQTVGPFADSKITLDYTNVTTNIGQAYSPVTAPAYTPVLTHMSTLGNYRHRHHYQAAPCFSSDAGVFTAPVRGVYYIRFTAMDNLSPARVVVSMFKNNQLITWAAQNNHGGNQYLSSAVTLELEEGDLVYMRLPSGNKLFDDDTISHSPFNGFLLFPIFVHDDDGGSAQSGLCADEGLDEGRLLPTDVGSCSPHHKHIKVVPRATRVLAYQPCYIRLVYRHLVDRTGHTRWPRWGERHCCAAAECAPALPSIRRSVNILRVKGTLFVAI
ncbi:unnamed protein product [Coregonus sp. 'balchen']|nr:unnamed protein product [Coregonus sp. 'balchen']